MNANLAIMETLAKVSEIYKGGVDPTFMARLLGQEGAVRKDYPTGLVGFDLEPAARVLQPVITPLRNRLPRVKGKGGTAANWRQITALDTNKTNQFPGFGTKANVLNYTETDRSATYKSLALGDNVSVEAIQQAMGLEDAKAQMAVRLLENVMIVEEQTLIAGLGTRALSAPAAPTITNNTGGGTIAANTYYVTVRACTGLGRSVAGQITGATSAISSRGIKSATNTSVTTAGSTSSLGMTTTAVKGALFYEWYVGLSNDITTCTLEAITSINSVLLTAVGAAGSTIIANNSQDSNSFDGLIAQGVTSSNDFSGFGYQKQLATGTAGTGTTFQLTDIDLMLLNLWQNYGADPEMLLMSPQQATDLTAKIRTAGLIRQVVENGDNNKMVGGQRVNSYVNPVTGRLIDVVADPWWFNGSILAMSLTLPAGVPLAETRNAYEVKTQLDYYQLEYAMVAPKYETEVRSLEAVAMYFGLGTGILWNVANG